jgi:glutamate--cysteine ligase
MAGKLPAYPNQIPTMSDWADQMTLPFPEVRLKRFLEMRGADGGPWRRLCALPALWTGLLYDQGALDAAWDLVKDWTAEQRTRLRADVPRQGFAARVGKTSVQDIARETVKIARDGLKARNVRNSTGENESVFLNVLDEIVTSGKTPADELLAAYETKWNHSVDPAFTEYAY